MAFQAAYPFPDSSLDGSMTFHNSDIFSCPAYDPYTVSQDTSHHQASHLALDPIGLLSAVQEDSTPWDFWPEFSGSDYQLGPPQDQQAILAAQDQNLGPSVQSSSEDKELKNIVSKLVHKVERLEQDIELRILNVEDTVSRLQIGLELEKSRLCDEIDTQIQQLQKWAGTIRSLVETAAELTNLKSARPASD
ncbi:hypothetical protein T440DRAFT_523483 [Plenodomus tracheiphilus IPT5]|uniref:Uncharacterized protein n=1 Tax=Plenodomus tracheiphilus IPT5 TaxID=1408161 RepID=A0A6A7AQI9_9PLEO|nr:hypothetical protein T440DRAFT_523483 [Plenodomus tracheiphilus IPT5]